DLSQVATACDTAGIQIASHASSAPPELSKSSSRSCARASAMVTRSFIGRTQLDRLCRAKIAPVSSVSSVLAASCKQSPILGVLQTRLRLRLAQCDPCVAGVGHHVTLCGI